MIENHKVETNDNCMDNKSFTIHISQIIHFIKKIIMFVFLLESYRLFKMHLNYNLYIRTKIHLLDIYHFI